MGDSNSKNKEINENEKKSRASPEKSDSNKTDETIKNSNNTNEATLESNSKNKEINESEKKSSASPEKSDSNKADETIKNSNNTNVATKYEIPKSRHCNNKQAGYMNVGLFNNNQDYMGMITGMLFYEMNNIVMTISGTAENNSQNDVQENKSDVNAATNNTDCNNVNETTNIICNDVNEATNGTELIIYNSNNVDVMTDYNSANTAANSTFPESIKCNNVDESANDLISKTDIDAKVNSFLNGEERKVLDKMDDVEIRLDVETKSIDLHDAAQTSKGAESSQMSCIDLCTYILLGEETINWEQRKFCYDNIFYVELNKCDNEYQQIEELFKRTTDDCLKIKTIHRIQNVFLTGSYLIKKEELQRRYNNQVRESLLFHGTRKENIENICVNNLDWRLYGQTKEVKLRNRFGRGVSFSPSANYSSCFCDKDTNEKVLLVFKVLIGPTCDGSESTVLPPVIPSTLSDIPVRYDTTVKPGFGVFVKYNDDEFYPAYQIAFTGPPSD